MASGLSFTYGDYEFSPRPLFTIGSEPLKTPDGSGYGIIHTITLNGEIITTGAAELDSGILGVFDKIEALKSALDHDGKLLLVSCDDVSILSGYPTIEPFDIQNTNDNYTRRAPYTIPFKMPTTILGSGNDVFNSSIQPPFIESCSESWDVEFQDERLPLVWTLEGGTVEKFGYVVAVTHTVNVAARLAYTGNQVSNIPWEDAKSYATGKLGFDNDFVTLTGILGLPGTSIYSTSDVFNQFRQVSTDKTNGTIQVVETFVVTPSGSNSLPNNAIETFDISSSQVDGIVQVSIQGEIQGLAQIGYIGGFNVTSSKFSAASGYYTVVKDRMYDRARTVYSGIAEECFNRPLNPIIKTRTVGMNPIEGTVSYNYEFDTTLPGCITGTCILSQNINIDDTQPTDVFAQQIVLGRAAGPILQDINTTTARVRTVNIELVTLPPTGCGSIAAIYEPVPTGQIADFISIVSGDLGDNFSQVFVSSQTQNWNFTMGRYTKSIGFTYNNCTG